MAAEHNGVDALMAALTDDPLPEGALTDADFMAEHWSAAADVALLREQLGLIGDALTSQEHTEPAAVPERRPAGVPARIPVRERPFWRPLRTLALGVAAVSAAGALITGSGWLLSQAGNGAEDASTSSSGEAAPSYSVGSDSDNGGGTKDGGGAAQLSHAGYLACARLVVEGTVTAVEPVPGADQDRITLRVTRYYKPAKGAAEVTFVMDKEVDPRLTVGVHTLIGIATDAVSPDTWSTGEKEIATQRAWITAALAESRTLACE
ncbi:hypothetical protein ACKI1I_36755 [Streptomyces turgidiscabies]|uniref:hypothetical protein n=1 Tax=Streptomyces TaxID=1883 RepID=UPI0002DC9463|nr:MULTISPECIES: hypothetical protein [Streptomyces]MDX3497740.1 hypothetical protein [Streptomyces turgidiscabies]GAQ68917.1 hypothetical protein T45_00636 [Streptomyces turgidiscabies]